MQINVFIVIAILVRRLCSFVSFYNKIYLTDEQSSRKPPFVALWRLARGAKGGARGKRQK